MREASPSAARTPVEQLEAVAVLERQVEHHQGGLRAPRSRAAPSPRRRAPTTRKPSAVEVVEQEGRVSLVVLDDQQRVAASSTRGLSRPRGSISPPLRKPDCKSRCIAPGGRNRP